MNRIRQYRPAFISGMENATVEFETVEQLLAIPFVAGFTEPVEWPFHRFSISPRQNGGRDVLMAEYDEGRHWWVVGFIEQPGQVDLPQWAPVVRSAEVPPAPAFPSAIDLGLPAIEAGVVEIGCRLTVDAGAVGLSRRSG